MTNPGMNLMPGGHLVLAGDSIAMTICDLSDNTAIDA
jgi:hypothetical protein